MSTPLRAQYLRLKQPFHDALLLFRLGDVYELYDEDARVAARELGVTLSMREFAGGERVALCPLPYHAVEEPIKRLVARGYKVAIAEQIGDPRATKGLVEREVVRVVSPSLALRPPVTPPSRDDTTGATGVASATGAPPLPPPGATRRTATAVIQLGLFDIDAHGGNQGR